MNSIALKLLATPTARQLAGVNNWAMSTCKNCYAFLGTSYIRGLWYVYTDSHRTNVWTYTNSYTDFGLEMGQMAISLLRTFDGFPLTKFEWIDLHTSVFMLPFPCSTVCSRLSEPRLSVSRHLDVRSSRHVFGTSGKRTLPSLEFCYRRKQSCCTNDFSECYNAFPMQYAI